MATGVIILHGCADIFRTVKVRIGSEFSELYFQIGHIVIDYPAVLWSWNEAFESKISKIITRPKALSHCNHIQGYLT